MRPLSPALLAAIAIVPVVAGLGGASVSGWDASAWTALMNTPGLWRSVALSLWTGGAATAISLGMFRTEVAAVAYAEELAQLGIKLAKVQPRTQPIAQSVIVVRDPQQSVVARLKDLQAQFPGSELKITACERAS